MNNSRADFFRLMNAYDRLAMDIFDVWYTLQEKDNKPNSIADIDFKFEYDCSTKEIEINTPVGDRRIPVSMLYHESKDDPELKMLWYSSYYDGPMSGLATYNGKKVWFDMEDDIYDNIFGVRTYNIYVLSDEDLERKEYWHQRFRDDVGHHTDYGDQYEPFDSDKTVSKSIFHNFFEDFKHYKHKKIDFTKCEHLGTFLYEEFDR